MTEGTEMHTEWIRIARNTQGIAGAMERSCEATVCLSGSQQKYLKSTHTPARNNRILQGTLSKRNHFFPTNRHPRKNVVYFKGDFIAILYDGIRWHNQSDGKRKNEINERDRQCLGAFFNPSVREHCHQWKANCHHNQHIPRTYLGGPFSIEWTKKQIVLQSCPNGAHTFEIAVAGK